MEIKVEQSKLAKALSNVSQVAAGSRSTLPILSNVLIKVDGGKATLTTTNLDLAVVTYLPTISTQDGEITVPAKLLADFVSNLPRGEVTISTKETKVTVSSSSYKSTLNGVYADEYPELPEINEKEAVIIKMNVDDFKLAINEIIFATSNDTTRPNLTGVYFNTAEGAMYVAATDGYRLTERKFVDKVSSEVKAIVPTASLNEVMRSIDDSAEEIEILFGDSQVRFRLGSTEVTSKLIDGAYPDYRKLIPTSSQVEVDLDTDELVRVAKLAELFARQSNGTICIETNKENGIVSVSSVANELGENKSEIKADVSDDTIVNIHAKYFIDALNALEEPKLQLGISGRMAPIIIKNEKSRDYVHIIMPLNR